MDPWKVGADERAKHDAQFATLTQGSHITGEQARGFFLQSNLPQMVLGQIWAMADITADGMMDRKEFSIAMTLIKRKLQGYQLPSSLPPSMWIEPSMGGTLPHGLPGLGASFPAMAPLSSATLPSRLPGQPQPLNNLAMPSSPARSLDGSEWAIPQASRLKYNQLFNKEDRKRLGYLTGLDARQLLMSTGLPQNLLAQIWALADVDGDGRLSSEEFSLAMFLADMVKIGQPLPMSLPPNLIPPSMRSRSRSNSGVLPAGAPLGVPTTRPTDSFGDLVPGGFGSVPRPQVNEPVEEAALSPLTLEDKRRENFAKGNAELERRRAELRDLQRKEEEARLAKDRAEQEKRDAIRREQERKRLAEQERQQERQRQLEAERDEQRRKALEARETARKEMERQRQQDWERQRKQALLMEKKRHEEAVQHLQSQVNNLKYELETMDNKKKELIVRISEGKENVIRSTGYIDDMRATRDSLISSVTSNEQIKNEQDRLHVRLTAECNQVKQSLQQRQAQNPISDNFKQQQNLYTNKKQQVESLRQQLNEVDTNKEALSADVAITKGSLNKLLESATGLQKTQKQSRDRAHSKRSEWELEKKQRATKKIRDEEEKRVNEAAEKQKQLEEKRKKEEEDKWSVLKDLDFSAPAATTTVPGGSAQSTDTWSSDWIKPSTASGAAPAAKPADIWGSKPASDNLWGAGSGSSQNNAITDLFADSSWGTPAADTTNSSLGTSATATTNSSWGTSDASWRTNFANNSTASHTSSETKESARKPGLILPPPKTPQKKETMFGADFSASKPSMAATPRKPEVVSATRKVEIYEVQYDFEARNADELDITVDDKLKVYPDEQDSAEPGWISGWKGERAGMFPEDYVIKLRDVYEPIATNELAKKAPSAAKNAPSAAEKAPFAAEHATGMTRSDSAFGEVRSSPNPENGSPAPAGLTCVAMYPWRAKKENHLSFNEGEEIKVSMQQDLWWQGSVAGGDEGWFPKSYVKPLDKAVVPSMQISVKEEMVNPNSRLYDQVPNYEPEPSRNDRLYDQVPGPSPAAVTPAAAPTTQQLTERYVALHDYESDIEGDLAFSAGEIVHVTSREGAEWWTGQIGTRRGIFPASYVGPSDGGNTPTAKTTSPAPMVATAVSSAPAPGSQLKEIGRVIAAYEATGPEQLSLKLNQLIHIRKKSPSGWWEGELMAKGQKKQIGWFPKDYVNMLPSAAGKSTDRPATPASEIESPRSKQPTPSPVPVPAVAVQAKVIASYPYTAQNEDELTFVQDDIITIVNKNDPDWWEGQLDGVSGVFPANYVQHYTEPS